MTKRLRLLIGLAVSLFFLAWLLWKVDLGLLWEALHHADYSWIILAAPVYFVGVWLRALRWQYLLAPVSPLRARRLFPYVVLGFMANNVLPLRAGELVRAFLLGQKAELSKTSILATILVERVLDALALLFFAVVVSLFVPLPEWLRTGVFVVGLAFVGVLAVSLAAAFLAGAALAVTGVLVRVLPGSLRPRIQELVRLFLDGLASLRNGRTLGRVSALSLAVWLVEAAVFVVVGNGFRLSLPFHAFLLTMATANLGISIPSSQGGIGVFEFIAASVLQGSFHTDFSQAAAYAFVVHATILAPVTVLGLFFLWREHLSIRSIGRGGQEEAGEAV
ncbi:MAG: lysylphosphatidylglycerol synthase transmembrane domain-containing protein [Dehalococcoidia bacterium]|nr:lysylphosphatidylglycerol synthase transmembrane domain-containing protein [Dehalococcoidia bacterium]